jgi:signal transduction histidine kinase
LSDLALVRTGRAVTGAAVLLGTASAVFALGTGELAFWWRSLGGLQAGLAVAFGIFVWLVLPNQPRNATVWAMAASAGVGITALVLALVPTLANGDPLEILDARWVPADSPPAVGWLLVVGNAASVPGLFVPLTLGLLLFPNGALPSSRWRPIAALAVAAVVVLAVSHGWWYRPGNTSRVENPVILGSGFVVVALAASALVSLLARYRCSTGTSRLQYKWVVWGTSVGVAVFAGFFFVPDTLVDHDGLILAATLAAVWWVVSYGVAVGRYRLYEIDAVISRSVVFVTLAALITGIYALVVVVVGSLIGGSDIWLSVLATALVAIAFEPVRTSSQRWANRLVYGRRATPYEVLAGLSRLLAVTESGEALLERLATELREATGVRRAAVWIRDDGALRPVAVAPAAAAASEAPAHGAGEQNLEFPIEHEGETVGYLVLDESAAVSLRPQERQLAADLAASAALVVAKVRLDHDLVTKAIEIDDSRRRLLDAQATELRRLERELEERVGQPVASMEAQLGLAERLARDEGCVRVAALLCRLGAETHAAGAQVRSLAHGMHPPLLAADGLPAAIGSLVARCPLDVRPDVALGQRYSADVEAAVYYCVAEALTNAAKHARGPVQVVVAGHDSGLTFSVTDAGPGFDPARNATGSGLHNIADRLDTLGGTITIASRLGAATTITGWLPVDSSPAAARLGSTQEGDHASSKADELKSAFATNATAPASSARSSYSS